MKKILLGIFMFISVAAWTQRTATPEKVMEKDRSGHFLFSFKMNEPLTAQESTNFAQWAKDNESLFGVTMSANVVTFELSTNNPDRNYFLKAFGILNITSMVDKRGKTITVEEFLTNNKL